MAAAVTLVGLVAVLWFLKASQRTSHASGVEYLQTALVAELATYYEERTVYPKTIYEIPTNHIKFGPGATSQMLQEFTYFSDGTNFTLNSKYGFGENQSRRGRPIDRGDSIIRSMNQRTA